MLIKENDKIYDIFRTYPFLKDSLISRNKMFKKLNDPILFNSLAKIARVKEIAKISGENLNELIDFLNDEIAKRNEMRF